LRISKLVIVAVAILVIIVVALVAFMALQGSGPPCTSTWNCAAGYPVQVSGSVAIAGQQCVNSLTEVVCIGGQDANGGPRNEVYTAAFSSSGNITAWTLDSNHYPRVINGQSCVLSGGYVYCVGGSYNANPDDVNSSYYAPLGARGIVGTWTSTTGFPIPADTESCVASSSYIYCVGGYNETDGTSVDFAPSNAVWFAKLSGLGISTWMKTTPYPTNFYIPTCVAGGGFVYCMAGIDENGNSVGATFFAALSASGVGAWTGTTAYPLPASGLDCVLPSTTIYCIGGVTAGGANPTFTSAVYSAQLSSSGISSWKSGPDYPLSVSTDCFSLSGNVYCVGGFDGSTLQENNAVKYAALASLSG
jgi:hypothetical protein